MMRIVASCQRELKKAASCFRACALVIDRLAQLSIVALARVEAVALPLSDLHLASFSFLPPVQPFSGLLQHETGRRPDRGANRQRSLKTSLRLAFEMGDPECV
jgi:hypothetical protein